MHYDFDMSDCHNRRHPWDPIVEAQERLPRWRAALHENYPSAPFDVCFTPEALETVLRTVGSMRPETGAKGFGPVECLGFDVIEFDHAGSRDAGNGVYRPDVGWGNARCEHHLQQVGSETRLWTGDIHSHPGGGGLPSKRVGRGLGDLGYVELIFEENPTMLWFLLPILTGMGGEYGEVVIHPWVCKRDGGLMTANLRVCDIAEFPRREFNPEWLREQEERELHPVAPTPEVRDFDPAGCDLSVEEKLGSTVWKSLRGQYTDRLGGIISPAFAERNVLVVGAGAGSFAVEKLARMCPRRIKICDFDIVSTANLSRTNYRYSDAVRGKLKVDALAERITEVNPLVEVVTYPCSITGVGQEALATIFDGVDLVIAGTDSFEAQAHINRVAFRSSVPAMFVGIHENASGGRVVWTVPGVTPCYRCAARERFEAAETNGEQALDLPSATGALVDCQFIDMVALKVAVAILERHEDSQMGRFYRKMEPRNDIVIRCDPELGWGNRLWDAVLSDLPKEPLNFAQELRDVVLFAMDTLWLTTPFDSNCPVCGSAEHATEVER